MPKHQEHLEFILKWSRHDNRAIARQKVSELTDFLINESGQGLNLNGADLSGCNLEGFNLRQATLNQSKIYGTNLAKADLSGSTLICPGMERTNLSGAILRGAYIHALAAQVCNFHDADLAGLVDATGSLFHGCSMPSVKASGSVFAGATFYQCDLEGADFSGANLQGCNFNECILDKANLSIAFLSQTTITKSRMQNTVLNQSMGRGLVLQRLTSCDGLQLLNADFPLLRCDGLRGSELKAEGLKAPNADFNECSLYNTNFSKATLSGSHWKSCHLEGADFSEAKLEAASFLTSSMPKIILERALAENLHVVESRLTGAKMAGFVGRCATFRDCDLAEADLSRAYLYRAMFTGDPPRAMCMREVDLRDAILVQAYITADLREANLRGANCTYARLNQCNMRAADLSGVSIYEASLVKTDFTDARLVGIEPPFFADRCPGLLAALEASAAPEALARVVSFLSRLEQLLRDSPKEST